VILISALVNIGQIIDLCLFFYQVACNGSELRGANLDNLWIQSLPELRVTSHVMEVDQKRFEGI
jgi:hypothetical protein